MKRGLWTLKCDRCGKTFSIELRDDESVLESVRTLPCPLCNVAPDFPDPSKKTLHWHTVVEFKLLLD